MKRTRRLGFTLIELLTVMAITAVILTLIIVPLIQSFNLTRQAQFLSEAQERARQLTERIAREAGNGAGVRDNSGTKGAVAVVVPGKPVSGVQPDVVVTLPYAKLDIVKPAEGDPARGPSGAFINPDTGKEDPTLQGPKGQIVLPIAPGMAIQRYFIGLREPIAADGTPAKYHNPFEGILMPKGSGRDNLYVLYRAEVQPYIFQAGGPVVNTELFLDEDGDNKPDDIDDPAFFTFLPTVDYDPATRILNATGQAKRDRIKAWLRKAVVISETSRFDMIAAQRDRSQRNEAALYETIADPMDTTPRERPRITPLAQFKPTRVSSEPAEGQNTVRLGEETDNAADLAPDVFLTKFGGLSNTIVRTWPTGWNRLDPNLNTYLVGRTDPANGLPGKAPGFSIYAFDPDSGEEAVDGMELFDVEAYVNGVSGGTTYPFFQAVINADARSNWLDDPDARDLFIAYFPDVQTGKLIASFGINEWGDPNVTPPVDNPNNLPALGTGAPDSPLTDADWSSQPYSPMPDPNLFELNGSFNRVWNEYPGLRPEIHRFIDLRVTPQGDGLQSPLNPDPMVGFPRARIVPGSEEVFGPDQTPGANYGRSVRYTRTTGAPGPNQYRINYVDQPEPDYALLGLPNPPPSYDPANFVSAVIQPRFKGGYIQLNSDPNVPLPQGVFQVYYRFQFTRPGDALAVDYDSRQVLGINLTIRVYAQGGLPRPQSVTLRTTAAVRNFIR